MLVLAIDTSFAPAGVALAREGRLLGEIFAVAASTHSQRLLPAVEFLLAQCQAGREQLEGLTVTLGPGLFTGLRIGLATAQGLALGLGLKVAGVSTLRVMAEACRSREGRLWAVADARRGLVYAAPFQVEGGEVRRLDQDAAMSPVRLAERLEPPALLVGEGAGMYREQLLAPGLELAPAWAGLPRPGLLALLGEELLESGNGVGPEEIKPRYLRPSEAEVRFGLPLDEYRLIE